MMEFFRKRKEKKWFHYKEKLKYIISDELELESWLQEIIMSIVEKEEQRRPNEEMVAWLKKWEEEARLPKYLEDEKLLADIYQNHTNWVEEKAQFHVDVREADDETLESLIKGFGEPMTTFKLTNQKTYIALWGEIFNAISQV